MSAREDADRGRGSGAPEGATHQPRPALGRRPWFAFLRRARSLRRFALAIAAWRVTAPLARATPGPITLVGDGWEAREVWPAVTGRARRVGLTPRAAGRAMLIRGAAVHGWGMEHPLLLAGIDRAGVVVAVRRLRPRRFAWMRRAAWILEMPPDTIVPCPGTRLSLRVPT